MSTSAIGGSSGPEISQPIAGTPDKLATDKSTFLKLLVAQLRYQNPLDPADGIQFVTQLAQFTSLEQSTEMRDELVAIRGLLEQQGSNSEAA